MMARWKRDAASGVAMRWATASPPADCPNAVTRPGSPPNACDVALHPAERLDLVQQAQVGGPAGARGQVPEDAKPVGHRDHDHAGFGNQRGRVEDRQIPRSGRIGPAVQPHHHRQPLAVVEIGRQGDGQALAILAAWKFAVAGAQHVIQEGHRSLRARRGQGGCREHIGPVRYGCGRLKTVRGGVRNAGGTHDGAVAPSGDRAARRLEGKVHSHTASAVFQQRHIGNKVNVLQHRRRRGRGIPGPDRVGDLAVGGERLFRPAGLSE